MSSPALLSLHDVCVSFGTHHLFDDLSMHIHAGDRIALVGKNGAGKTTLMRLITAEREADDGKRWAQPGLTIGELPQEVEVVVGKTVFDYVFTGLPKERQTEEERYKVETIAEPLELDLLATMETLSGGELRRAGLARALIEEADILMLDEPTNHLDLDAIEWLENYLKSWRGALICVSHDRAFLRNVSNMIFWLDRGRIRVCPRGFSHFEKWSEELLTQEARELQKREKLLAQEVEWAAGGISARRKRNVKRLEDMKSERDRLKKDRSMFNQTMRKIELAPLGAGAETKMVAEFIKASKSYGDTRILDQFNLRIMRGDRIGILGANGAGKTTFLRLLTGEETADGGKVKRAKDLEFSYFDQKRKDLNPKNTIKHSLCPGGGDYIDVAGKHRHVCGYMRDFLFDPKDVEVIVGTLSGGQKNRLMLAKTLANPKDFLILDEPTNDLDMETLDMLEDILAKYEGTLIIVSHDRDFLDQTVSKMLVFEGRGEVTPIIGGYQDYLNAAKAKPIDMHKKADGSVDVEEKPLKQKEPSAKMTYKLKFELEQLPAKINMLEVEMQNLQKKLDDPDFYTRDAAGFNDCSKKFLELKQQLDAAETRWLELVEISEESC